MGLLIFDFEKRLLSFLLLLLNHPALCLPVYSLRSALAGHRFIDNTATTIAIQHITHISTYYMQWGNKNIGSKSTVNFSTALYIKKDTLHYVINKDPPGKMRTLLTPPRHSWTNTRTKTGHFHNTPSHKNRITTQLQKTTPLPKTPGHYSPALLPP